MSMSSFRGIFKALAISFAVSILGALKPFSMALMVFIFKPASYAR